MITTLTLSRDTGDGWIGTLPDQTECYIPYGAIHNREGTEFTAVVTENRRSYPKWFAVRLRPSSQIKPEDIKPPLGVFHGYSDVCEMAYAAGLCDKLTAYSNGKVVDNGDGVWYVSDVKNIYVEEYDNE
jgi:hypothetical protein